jgi:homoserine O-acetyltransferase
MMKPNPRADQYARGRSPSESVTEAMPVTGSWQPNDPVASRKFIDAGQLALELGGQLPEVTVAFETWGTLDEAGTNAVLVEHALTGDAHVHGGVGPGQKTPGWWHELIGPGKPLDTDRYFIVASNVLGGCQGTTGPASLAPDGRAWGSRFPRITVADQVEVERRLAALLGVKRWAAVIGGSMGGMRALEWVVAHPGKVDSALLLATSAYATADQIATQSTQITAITSDPNWRGGNYHDAAPGCGPHVGLGLARRIAQATYRSANEFNLRFGREHQLGENPLEDGRFSVESYLDHHAEKLARRFDAGSYVALTDAMTTFDVGRNRGGVRAALNNVTVPVVVAGIDSDRLYPLDLQFELAETIATAKPATVIESAFGHDAFLIEIDAIAPLISETLSQARLRASTRG